MIKIFSFLLPALVPIAIGIHGIVPCFRQLADQGSVRHSATIFCNLEKFFASLRSLCIFA
jgi:hypothetical protein